MDKERFLSQVDRPLHTFNPTGSSLAAESWQTGNEDGGREMTLNFHPDHLADLRNPGLSDETVRDGDIFFERIPKELTVLPQWVCWKFAETEKGKPTKIPINAQTGAKAKTNDPETWSPFDKVTAFYRENNNGNGVRIQGIGFVVSDADGFAGVDLDHCRNSETGEIEPWAQDIINRLNSYSEISPSGTGVRIFVKGKLPGPGNKKGDFEVYEKGRFFTITGHHIEGTPLTVEHRQAEINEIHQEIFGQGTNATPTPNSQSQPKRYRESQPLEDLEVIKKAKSAINGDRFTQLWEGNISGYTSHSEADLALCGKLAFWTGNNQEQIDRLFRISGLFREKWDEKHYGDGRTYGQGVIEEAVSGTRETYRPNFRTSNAPKSVNGTDLVFASALEVVKGIRQSENLKESLIKAMESPEILQAFVLVSNQDPGFFEATLGDMRNKGLPVRTIDVFRKLIKDKSKEERFKLRSLKPEEASQLKTACEMLPDCSCPYPALLIPRNYSLSLSGTETLEFIQGTTIPIPQVIAHAPILITGRFRNSEEGIEYFRLAWFRNNRWIDKVVDRGICLDPRKLLTLASNGFPVAGDNNTKIAAYLHQLEAINIATLPQMRVSDHMGWQGKDGRKGFLWGRKLISPYGELTSELNIENLAPEDWRDDWTAFRGMASGDEQIADGFKSLGTFEEWQKIIGPLHYYPKVLIGLYASFAAPLLHILNAPNFVVDFANRTSTGKTTILRIAASVWGLPDEKGDGAMSSWDATKVWLERASAILNGIPLILDDTKRAKKLQMVAEMIYAIVQGRGRGRGNTQSLARTRTWQTVLISSGEAPATSFTQDGGSRVRCLEIRGTPFIRDSERIRRVVDETNNRLLLNYGHAGPAFISWLLKNRSSWKEFKDEYHKFIEKYAGIAGTTEGGRLAQGFAVLHMAEILTWKAGITPWDFEERINEVWPMIAAEAIDAAGEVRAFHDLYSWAVSNEYRFWGRHLTDNEGKPKSPPGGWAGRWDELRDWDEIGFIRTVLKSELKRMGYSPDAILAGWKELGWIEKSNEKNGGYTLQRYINGTKDRMIVIKRETIDALDY